MKLLTVFTFLLGLSAAAQDFDYTSNTTKSVSGSYTHSGYCSGSNQYSCVWNLKELAKRYAQNEVRTVCEIYERGRLQAWTVSCYEYCTPSYIPNDQNNVYVSCRSDCRGDCEIEGY